MTRRFEATVLGLFTLLISFVSARHEPWKDETQAWRLAIDSHGVADLVHNARYEGHPLLWHLMLQALGHLSRSWWAVAVLHVLIACAGAWLVLRYAPFTRLQKVLIVFGYWAAYEYAVVARPYGLGMTLAFAACVAWCARPRRVLVSVICLVLLANTTAMGTMLALALAAAFAFDWAWPDDEAARPSRRVVATVGAIVGIATIVVFYFAVAQIRPPADAAYQGSAPGTRSLWSIASAPTYELRALFPLVMIRGTAMWNRWVLEFQSRYDLALVLALTLIFLVIGLVIAARRRVSLFFYFIGTGGYLLFFTFFFDGTAHHHGYLYIVWVVAAWLAFTGAPSERPRALHALAARADEMRGRLFALSLVAPVAATIELSIADVLTPFSDAPHAASVIRDAGLIDAPTIGIIRSHSQAVSAFMDRPVLFPLEGKSRTFVVWGNTAGEYDRTVRAADSAATALLARHCRVVIISSPSQDVAPRTATRAHLLYTTTFRPMSGDRYRVWVLSAPESARCPAPRYPSTPPRSTQQPNPTS